MKRKNEDENSKDTKREKTLKVGGNHLACSASLAVLQVLEKEKLCDHAKAMGEYFVQRAKELAFVKTIKGRGLMLGLEFEYEVGALRKELIFKHRIFTGGSSNKNLIRILPPLNIKQKQNLKPLAEPLLSAMTTLNQVFESIYRQ